MGHDEEDVMQFAITVLGAGAVALLAKNQRQRSKVGDKDG